MISQAWSELSGCVPAIESSEQIGQCQIRKRPSLSDTVYIYLLLCSGMFVSFLAGLGQKSSPTWICFTQIETYNNIARYNLIDTKYHQMAFRSPSEGAPITVRWRSDQSQPAIFLNTWSNKSEWWPPEGDNPWNLLFSSQIVHKTVNRSVH